MSSIYFSTKPQKTELVSTQNRIIKTAIPCEGTEETLAGLSSLESRSMHGQIPLVWDKAEDFSIYDKAGNKWIDFTSGIFFANIGHSNPRVSDAIISATKRPLIGSYSYANSSRLDYLKNLIKSTNSHFEKAFLMSAGTEATEGAFKLMRMNGQKRRKKRLGIICLKVIGMEELWVLN